MKLALLAVLLSAFQLTQAALQTTEENYKFEISSKFGEVSVDPGNDTHLGAVKFNFHQEVPYFILNLVMYSMTTKTITLNETLNICKILKKATSFKFHKEMESNGNQLPMYRIEVCPIKKVIAKYANDVLLMMLFFQREK